MGRAQRMVRSDLDVECPGHVSLVAGAQRAFQFGLRFSAKARGPSMVSSERSAKALLSSFG